MKLKYIFKISRKHIFRDLIQVIFIVLLSGFIALELLFGSLIIMAAFFSEGCTEMRAPLKKAFWGLNQVMGMHKKLEGSIPYTNAEDFAAMMKKRMSVLDRGRPYTEDEIKQYKLSEYKNKPMMVTADGIMFAVTKFESGCKTVDAVNLENSSCLIDVDVNNQRKPNSRKFSPKRPNSTDRYTFIIDGNKDEAVIPEIYKSLEIDEGWEKAKQKYGY